MKLSKSESGRLGAIASASICKELKEKRISAYYKKPKLCKQCSTPIKYLKRQNDYCNHTCAGFYANKDRPKKIKKPNNRKILQEKRIIDGLCRVRLTLKRYLVKIFGHICSVCKGTKWNKNIIPLELDHIDGNAGNNLPTNLRLICPNCHAQTPTAKGKNRGKGRKARGLPVH